MAGELDMNIELTWVPFKITPRSAGMMRQFDRIEYVVRIFGIVVGLVVVLKK